VSKSAKKNILFANTMKNILYLASQSFSRQQLLKEAKIPFRVLAQSADEQACDWGLPLDKLVASIACYKMEHAQLPDGKEGDVIFVLTADTLSQDKNGAIQGKPKDRADAIAKIRQARNGTRLCTAFCLDKKKFQQGTWQLVERVMQVISAEYLFLVPDTWLEQYLNNTISLSVSNAIAVEQYGTQFLKDVRGSYSTIVGLPMFQVREALERLEFF
jgi:septum formation protein